MPTRNQGRGGGHNKGPQDRSRSFAHDFGSSRWRAGDWAAGCIFKRMLAVTYSQLMALMVALSVSLAALVWPPPAHAADSSAAAARLLDAKTLATASLGLRQALQHITSSDIKSGQLSEQMLAQPTLHRSVVESRQRLLHEERARLSETFLKQLQKFASGLRKLPVHWVSRIAEQQRVPLDARIDTLLAEKFGRAFVAARAAAVSHQRAKLALELRPPAAGVEGLVRDDTASFIRMPERALAAFANARGQRLIEQVVADVRAGQVLFAENEQHVQSLASVPLVSVYKRCGVSFGSRFNIVVATVLTACRLPNGSYKTVRLWRQKLATTSNGLESCPSLGNSHSAALTDWKCAT